MLQLSGEKMSKSLGNLVTVEEFLTGHRGDVLRMLVLNSSYRSPLTYTDEVVEQAGRALERLKGALRPASPAAEPPAEAEKALEGGGASAQALGGAQAVLSELAGVLGLRLEEGDGRQQEAGRFIDLLVELREELRVAKQWALADRVRERLQELGVTLEDGKAGTTWKAR